MLLSLAFVAVAAAHSHITNFIINGQSYPGFNPEESNADVLAAWSTDVEADGFVDPSDYRDPDIVCHVNASNARGYATVAAGDAITFQWRGWPLNHHGPVLSYMAHCGSDSDGGACATVDKSQLEFFEVQRAGLLDPDILSDPSSAAMGLWATDVLISNNNTFLVEIPPSLKSGYYVLRHELIALHFAAIPEQGPQHYPQCFTLYVTGNGTDTPEGVLATELYYKDDPGLTYDILQETLPPYPIPGPSLAEGAVSMPAQSSSTITGGATATPLGDEGWS